MSRWIRCNICTHGINRQQLEWRDDTLFAKLKFVVILIERIYSHNLIWLAQISACNQSKASF